MFTLPEHYWGFPTKPRLSVATLKTLNPKVTKHHLQQFPCRCPSQINLLHHSLRKWELGDARAQHWGPPGEGHTNTGVLLHIFLCCNHIALGQIEESVQKSQLSLIVNHFTTCNTETGQAESRARPAASSSSNRVHQQGFVSWLSHHFPGSVCEIKTYGFLIWLDPVSHPRDERLPYNVSNPVLHNIFTERQISHTCGKDKAWYLHPFCTGRFLRWLPFK